MVTATMAERQRRTYISKNGFTPSTNKLVGSSTYTIFYCIIFYISYKIWGFEIFDDIWFWAFNFITFPLVGWFLRKIGFWVY
jgi:hypothetical protein